MALAVRETMRQASTALLAANHGLAQEVVVRDAAIGVLYRVVEDRVYDMAAGEQHVLPAPGQRSHADRCFEFTASG